MLRSILKVVALALVAGACGAGAYLLGRSGGEDLDAARAAGQAEGQKQGTASGSKRGYEKGFTLGRDAGYQRSFAAAYREAYLNVFEAAGLEPPRPIPIPKSAPAAGNAGETSGG